ncbi:SAM-dependent methyltransferase [Actinomadura miaoliensis]|uniref:SAM-dependent methyltransferase n=1 Tax=Actinomadura miaoliensis TaxID=430685 RepID=A0ABP7VTN5_9ACTN
MSFGSHEPAAAPGPPHDVDVSRPSAARVYDHMLGGKDNFEVDREAARKILDVAPEMADVALENRRWLVRVVQYMIRQGIAQFIDLGSGLPTQDNVHEVAQRERPDARVVYVDRDPMVLSHARALLGSPDLTAYVHADIRDVAGVFESPEVGRLIDPSRPVGLLAVAVFHFIADEDDPAGLARRYFERLPGGSMVAISAWPSDDLSEDLRQRVRENFTNVPSPLHPRPRAKIAELFDGLKIVEPGLVSVSDWPTPGQAPPSPVRTFGGVAHVPDTAAVDR